MACNPGHYELASDIRAMKNVKIDYQYYSVLIENSYISLTESADGKNKISNLLNKIKQKSSKIFNNILSTSKCTFPSNLLLLTSVISIVGGFLSIVKLISVSSDLLLVASVELTIIV